MVVIRRRLLRALLALIAVTALSAAVAIPAMAASGGDSNRGDIWVDTVGSAAGPGHEMDPHLPCADINLWGDKMADSSGTYTIDSWPPTGNGSVAYRSSWHYNLAVGGKQVISKISWRVLIANARAGGAAPVNKNGYHFKIQLVQDPQKHKTFWIACTASSEVKSGGQNKPLTVSGTSATSGGASASGTAVGALAQTGAGLPFSALLGFLLISLGVALGARRPTSASLRR